MSLENVHEEVPAERSPAALTSGDHRVGGVSTRPLNVVAFKFGGSSLLGAERMLHAASLVRSAAAVSNVTVIGGSSGPSSPAPARAKAVPTLGCPAKGTSIVGVKMRTRRV